jgi:arylsulfatase A-like enzyme
MISMNRISFFSLSVVMVLFCSQPVRAERPNIVLIMADDMGWSDIGCFGGEIATPHLDDLAARGVRWTQFYDGARCCPTRAQLLTGLYAHQAGIGFMEPTNAYNAPFKHIPEYQGFLHRRCLTLAEVLRVAGYQTFIAGKWHVGAAAGQRPLDRGFERFFGLYGGACSFFFPREGQIVDQDQPLWPLPDDFYTTDYFARRAADFVGQAQRDRPFFLYLAFTAPHWPLHAWPQDIAKYRGKYRDGWQTLRERRLQRQKELGLFPPELELSPVHPDALQWTTEDADDMDLRMAVYAAMVDRMDQGIGQVIAALRETGREENTLVMFLSDNGACAEPIGKGKPDALRADHPRSFQGVLLPWANASNTPFRQFKHWTHEGGIATPLIACWPGRIPAGSINRKQVGHVIDLMPTVVELAEFPREIAGVSSDR